MKSRFKIIKKKPFNSHGCCDLLEENVTSIKLLRIKRNGYIEVPDEL